MDTKNVDLINWNPFTEGYFEDPYTHFSECRKTNPIQSSTSVGNFVVLFRHNDVKKVLKYPGIHTADLSGFLKSKEPLIFKNSNSCPYLAKSSNKWLMYLNGKEHETALNYCQRGLDRFNYEKIVEEAVETTLENLSKNAAPNINLVDVAVEFPFIIINKMMGIPVHNLQDKFIKVVHSLAYSQDMFLSKNTYLEINKDMEWIFLLLSDLYEKTKTEDTLISYLKDLNNDENWGFTKDEIISMLIILFMAAIETSKDTISMIFFEILKNRKLIDILKNGDKIQTNLLVEEFLRFTSPVQYTIRENKEEMKIENIVIPSNSKILLCLASANRDESVFKNPNLIIPTRDHNPHLSFGMGLHSCIGAKLSRIELRSFLPKIAPWIEAFDFHPSHPPVWQKTIMMRGLKHLHVLK